MEFTPLQIAKLVLGYLKKEKCHATVLTFCDASPHLKNFSETIKNRRKFFITRVNGLSLVDYLTEYAVIYTLVQERLEDTDYFEEKRSKNLVDELRYLLDANGRQNRENSPAQSRSSTPMRELHKERGRLHFPKNLSVIGEASACDTTPLKSLPGNSNDGAPNKVLRCTKSSSPPRSCKSDENGESDSEDSPDKSLELDEDDLSMQMLTQTLLEHHELHEKIAENINLFRSTTEATTPVASTEERISSGVLQELDSAIKAIVQKTEADPIFEKLIGEIIGNVGETTTDEEQTDGKKNGENADVLTKSVQDQESGLATPVLQSEENSLKQRPTDTKKQSSERRTDDDQENVALNFATSEHPIQFGNLAEVNENVPISDPTKINVQQNLTVNTTTGEIILYDGTLDNFMKTSSTAVAHPSNPLVYNNGLLMVQPSVPALMPAVSTLQVNQNKPCYMWNGSQLLNQGILNNLVAPATTNQQPTLPLKKFVKIAPRLDKTADNIGEFLTLYQCNDSNDSCPPQKIQDLKPRVKTKKKIRKAAQNTSTLSAIRVEVLNPAEEVPLDELKVEAENRSPASPGCESKRAIETASDAEKVAESNRSASKTPELVKKNSERQRSLSTPKSGSLSHVRALDFNFGTPGKPSKETTSPKSAKKNSKKSPRTSTTKISKSLFGTPTKIQKAERDKTVDVVDKKEDAAEKSEVAEIATAKDEIKRARNSWDSDLRALTGPMSDRCPTPKRKRNDSLRLRKIVKRPKIEGGADSERVEPNCSTESVDGLKKSKDKLKRKPKIGGKDSTTPNIIIKNKPPPTTTTEKPDKIIKTEEDNAKATNPVEMPEAPADVNYTKDCETNDVPMVSEMPFSLINCNAKARYKRKCNIDNNLKKEVKITKVKEIKSLEFINDGSNKLILSPSKLNANKRTLVENVDEKDMKLQCPIEDESKKLIKDMVVIEQNVLRLENRTITEENSLKNEKSTTELVSSTSKGEAPSKFITPEMQKDALIQHPVVSKRNVTPILETPIKMVMSQCPKTPGLLSPVSNTDTPFTKVFKEQLQGVDISCIQTPKFPLTPNFPFTPTTDGVSPYPERRSDYSTSSSYYQPSDAEQNKSLEQLMIDECKRLENRKETPVKINVQEVEESPAISVVDDKEVQKPAENVAEEVNESEQDLTNKAIVEKMKALSSNIIARKNLSLMDKDNVKSDDSSCTCSSSDDDSESSDGGSDDSMWNSTNNETVVQKSKSEMTISSRYNLRSRKGNVLPPQKEISGVAAEADKTTEVIQQIIAEMEIKPTLESTTTNTSALSNHQEKVLREMEQKRQRMIAKLKDDQNIKSKEKASEPTADSKRKKLKCDEKTPKAVRKRFSTTRETNGRFMKAPAVSRDATKSAVKKPVSRRKSKSPKKILLNVNGTNAAETSAPPTNPQEKFPGEAEGVRFHLSSDSECTKLEPFDLVETELRESSTSSAPLPLCKIPESHPLKNFHIVLETITISQNEKNKESNSDQEAESLVKGLKEWGIHLIHNKSPKKQDKAQDGPNRIDSHEPEAKQNGKSEDFLRVITKTENARDNSEGHCETVNNTDQIHSEANDKKDELRRNDQTCSTKGKSHKANESLEEGEILSEEERGNAEVKKSKPKHSESRRDHRRRYFAERKPIKYQYRSTLSPRKSYSSSTSKSKVERTKSASSKSKVESRPSVIPKSKSKDEITPKKDIDTEKIPPEIASVNKILDDLKLPNSIGKLAFDVTFFPRENLRLVHDESKTCDKELRQYDSELLNKKIAAKVYIESADAEIEKFMTVTPLDFILDIPEGFGCKSTGSKVKILDCVTLHAKKRDAKDDGKNNLSTASPLDNLYEPETSSRYETKTFKYKTAVHTSSSARRKSVDQKSECLKNSATARQSRSKSVDQKMLLTFPVVEKKNVVYKQADKSKLKSADREKRVTTKDVSQIKQKKSAATTKENKKQSADVKNSLSCGSNDCKVSTSTEAVASSDKKVEVLGDLEETSKETGKIAEIIEKVTDDNVIVAENINDDLMNYAICGSERAENIEESINKQKVNENVGDKLHNCQELLSKLDVDVFLSKLHGE